MTYAYAWYEDGVLSGASTSSVFPSASTTKHRTYRVVVTPSDGTGTGPSAQAERTVDNADPVLSGPTLSAASVQVGDTLTCSASATDADAADSPDVSYEWQDGSTGATYTVAEGDDPGDTLTCTATADDDDGGTDTGTASATVINTDPVVTTVTVTPSSGQVGDTLTCAATATDADGGAPTLTYSWTDGSTASTYTLVDSDDPGDIVTCTVTATDADGGTDTGSASATVTNTDPVLGTVSISPASANNDDTLTCAASATDADGGTPTVTYAWSGSSAGSLGTGSSVDLSATSAVSGETITCTATATDVNSGTDVGTATRDLSNRAPSVTVSMSPSSGATRTDTLTCTASVSDDDDDSLTTTFAWTVQGSPVTATSTSTLASSLAGAFVAGNLVACTATTTDGKGGSDDDTASTTITNTAPTVSAVTLSPSSVYTNDTLTATATASDADGDTLTVTYDWYVDGTSVQNTSSATLDGSATTGGFDKDQPVYVVVTADDGTDTVTSTSATLTVLNTKPGAPVVTIDPGDPVIGDDLFCDVTTESNDADGDAVTYTMAWTVDTASHTGALTTTWTDDTVDGADTAVDEVWECVATPNDGDDDGSTTSDSVTITQSCNDGSVVLTSSNVDFVEVCAGSFDMGCTTGQSSCDSDESPVMPVTLSRNYYLSQTEITQAQYQALMGSNPSNFTSCGTDCPVEQVTWHMAAAFANAMSTAEGLTECYDCTGSGSSVSCDLALEVYACEGYRLPTEAEWEGAARCGEDLLYAGSNTAGDVGWYSANSSSSTQPVAGLDANACGLFDMSGNVNEWVYDWLGSTYYTSSGRTDPEGTASGSDRVLRSGSWKTSTASNGLRVAQRGWGNPTSSWDYVGFRLARTVDDDYDGDGYLLSEDCDDTDILAYDDNGASEDCAALSCEDILDRGYSDGNGTYWIDPDGSGAFEVDCEMTIDGGGWTPLVSDYLTTLSSTDREYLYSDGTAWYVSPSTTLVWSWTSYQSLGGSYAYATSGDTATGSFSCTPVESSDWGIGCSTGPGVKYKLNPGNNGVCSADYDEVSGTSCVCQDLPDAYGVGACAADVQIYARP